MTKNLTIILCSLSLLSLACDDKTPSDTKVDIGQVQDGGKDVEPSDLSKTGDASVDQAGDIAKDASKDIAQDSSEPLPDKPNILLIIADDFGVDAAPGYLPNAEKPTMKNLAALAESGMTFDRVWANPICSPTRAGILTGRYGVRTGVLAPTAPKNAIGLSETSIQKYLSENTDYKSAVIGKWHLSGADNGRANNPAMMGVETYRGMISGTHDDYSNWQLTENGTRSTVTTYSTTYFSDDAIDWVKSQPETQPWFLWLAYTAPHSPFHLPAASLLQSDGAKALTESASNLEKYKAMLEALDTEMGRVLDSVDLDNTIVIFIGDNGTPRQVVQSYSNDHAKATLYQGGIHVPMVVSGPGVLKGVRTDAMVNSTDIFSTLADLAGTGLTNQNDSQSFKKVLLGEAGTRDILYSDVDVDGAASGWTVRDERYKLIVNTNGQKEFYDLQEDPLERVDLATNLSAAEQTRFTELEGKGESIRASNP